MSEANVSSLRTFNFEHIGWKYYNNIKKKAMEQEFSWTGLFLSLSIAFFIVIFTAVCLSVFYQAVIGGTMRADLENRFYKLERGQSYENYIQVEMISQEKIKNLEKASLA
jgi:hypothetical protein